MSAGVHQKEAPGSVGILGFAGSEAGLAEKRRLLIAEDSCDWNILDRWNLCGPINFATGTNLREHVLRNSEGVEYVVVPRESFEIEQLRAACVCHVGDVDAALTAAGELPNEILVHVPEQHLAGFGPFTHSGYVIEDPTYFQAAEISREREAGFLAEAVLAAVSRKFGNVICNARILPDQSIANRLAR